MQGRYHLGLGLATGVTVGLLTSNNQLTPALCTTFACCFGSIFPDIDSKASKMGQISKASSFIIRILFGHRGIIHTPLFLILANIPLYLLIAKYSLPMYLLLGFDIGFLLHLIQDSCTKRGIKWAFPFSQKSFSIVKLSSGKHDFLEFALSAIIYTIVTCITLFITFEILGITDYRIYFKF